MTLRQSIFQAREMLLDYLENKLDKDRSDLVKKVLASDIETERALNQITRGLDFAKQLSNVKINENFSDQLLQAENLSSLVVHYSKFKNWSHAFRVSTYAVTTCLLVLLIVISLPKNLLVKLKRTKSSQEVVLSQVPKNQEPPGDSDDPEKRDAQAVAVQNLPTDTDEDEGDNAESGDAEGSGDEHAEPIVIAKASPPPAKAVPSKAASTEATSSAEDAQGADGAGQTNEDTGDKKTKGFVYRGTMKIDDLDERTPLIAQQIIDLGGKKAGEVELGWKKDNKGSYYHFSMPESNYEKFLEYLHGFGPVRFSKDSHPRVMPPGQIRIILWVERKNE